MKIKSILLFVLVSQISYSQDNLISYKIPLCVLDSVSKNNKIKNNLACIWETEKSNQILIFFDYSEVDSLLYKLIKSSNRMIITDQGKFIPIIFNSDLKHSTLFFKEEEDVIESFGEYIIGGYVIYFEGTYTSGKVIKAFFDR
jgi:hypothetical protein